MDDKKDSNAQASVSSPSSDPSSSKIITAVARVQRNVAEKLRRDKLNGYISELATIVPIVSKAAKRMDKTSILRLSAAYLRICKSPLSGRKKLKSFKWCPNFLNPDQVRDILESVDGFLLVAEASGKILFTSRSVERYLGHQDIDLVGHALHIFIHPEDVEIVKSELNQLLFAYSKKDISKSLPRCSFYCRMKEKSQPRSEVQTYQFVHIMGAMTVIEEEDSESSMKKTTPTFKAFIKIVDADPYNQLSLEEAIADEYVTRHSLDGTIIFTDHRISTITGHMPHEVTGFNAYKFIHADDISVALFAHHLMFSNNKGTGLIVYRLRTSDDKYVYLKSVGCLQYDSSTSQVDHFVCVNQQLSELEGKAQLKYFTEQFIPHIKGSTASSLFESVKALQKSSCKTSTSPSAANPNDSINTVAVVHKNGKLKQSETNSVIDKFEETDSSEINTSTKDNLNETQISNMDTNYINTLGDDSGGSTFALKTPLISTKSNESQLEKSLIDNHNGKFTNANFITEQDNSIRTNDLFSSEVSNNSIYNITENIYTSATSQSQLPSIATTNSNCNIKTGNEVTPIYIDASNFSSNILEPKPLHLAVVTVQNTDPPGKFIQLHNLESVHIISKNGIEDDEEMSSNDNSIYNNSKTDLFCSNNLQFVKDFQDSMTVDNSNFYVKDPETLQSDSEIHSLLLAKSNSADNTQLSTLDSDDSETIALMSPMCPLRKGFNLVDSTNGTDSPNSSMSFCDGSFRQSEADFKEILPFHNNLSTLLSSTLPQEDSSSSIPSSTEWNDFYQPTEFLDPLNTEELIIKDDDLSSENIKVELW